MKRRKFFSQIAAATAAPALVAQQSPAPNNKPAATSPAPAPQDATQPPAPYNRTPGPAVESPKLETAVPDEVGETTARYFSAQQFATLKKLSDILMPSISGVPGALQSGAVEFLDFLISESPKDRQTLYKNGLDQLAAQSKKRFSKSFADLDDSQASELLAPLRQPWTYEGPADPTAKFLWAAKQDVRTATLNSREYASAARSSGRRSVAGIGLYWHSLD